MLPELLAAEFKQCGRPNRVLPYLTYSHNLHRPILMAFLVMYKAAPVHDYVPACLDEVHTSDRQFTRGS